LQELRYFFNSVSIATSVKQYDNSAFSHTDMRNVRQIRENHPMKIFLVYAHPEPRSFNGAMKDLAVSTLTKQGHEVVVSDLYAIAFWAGAGRKDFVVQDDGALNLQAGQLLAANNAGFAPEIASEIEKLQDCDLFILQFPLWWFFIPGIVKGWIDRVFAYGVTYGPSTNLVGRKAMVVTTTGGPTDA
jgi:NAD(P)H dehydrogenase (quinone)